MRAPPARCEAGLEAGQRGALGRRALLYSLASVATLAGPGAQLLQPQAALAAAYTVVPTGSVRAKEARLQEVTKQYAADPSDPYIFGEKAQLEFDIKALQRNSEYTSALDDALSSSDPSRGYLQRISLPVASMEPELKFWMSGLGAQLRSTRLVDGRNVSVVSFGPESLQREDGAKFGLELIESEGAGYNPEAQAFQYIQLAIPVFRLSQAIFFGGAIESAYGWTSLTTPAGIPLRVKIDETRRDPFELVALRTSSMKGAISHYEGMGMRAAQPKGRQKLSIKSIDQNSFFESSDAMEPDRELGSVQMSFDEESAGLLLLPPRSRAKKLATEPIRLRALGAAKGAQFESVETTFMSSRDFERELLAEGQIANDKCLADKCADEAPRGPKRVRAEVV